MKPVHDEANSGDLQRNSAIDRPKPPIRALHDDAGIDQRLLDDSTWVAHGPLSGIRLSNDARWPWLILVPRVPGARELIDLSPTDQLQLLEEINRCSRALQQCYSPDKLNVAALGNVVAQLHVHVIARHHSDPAWPAPVWGRGAALPYTETELADCLSQIRSELDFG